MKKIVLLMLFIFTISIYGFTGFDEVRSFKNGAAAVALNGKWGFVDNSGKKIIETKYDSVLDFSEGYSAVLTASGKWKYIDKSGKDLTLPIYDYALGFKNGVARVSRDGKYCFIGIDGKEKGRMYTVVFEYQDDISVVNNGGIIDENGGVSGGKFAYMDKSGKIISKWYDDTFDFYEGMGMVRSGDKYGFLDKSCKEVVELKYEKAWNFSNGMAGVMLNGKFGYVDKTGKLVIPAKYDQVYNFNNEVAVVVNNAEIDEVTGEIFAGEYFLIDKKGNQLSKVYDTIYESSDGVLVFKKEDKYGVIDLTGKEIIPASYYYLGDCFDNRISIKEYVNDLPMFGYIDKNGKVIIPVKYEEAYIFKNGVAVVREAGKYGLIDKNGKTLIAVKYDTMYYTDENKENVVGVEGLIYDEEGEVISNGISTMFDLSGKKLVDSKYEKVLGFSEERAAVMKGGKWWFVDKNGKELAE